MKKTWSVYLKRIKRLQDHLKRMRLLIEDPLDVFYLTGVKLSSGQILITPSSATLFVDGRYTETAKQQSPIPVRARNAQLPASALTLGFDRHKTTYERYMQLKKQCNVKPLPSLVNQLRSIKDPQEIQAMHKSAKLLWEGI